jgi:hypothetical protein
MCNGWKNYATWNVALWIDNDQGSYSTRCEMAQKCWDNTLDKEDAKCSLAESLKDYVEEMNPIRDQSSLFNDLLNAALGEVDWYEIADSFLDDVDMTEDEEEEETEDEEEEETEDEEEEETEEV